MMVVEELILLVLKLDSEAVLFTLRTTTGLHCTRIVSLVDLLLELGNRSVDYFLPQLFRA